MCKVFKKMNSNLLTVEKRFNKGKVSS